MLSIAGLIATNPRDEFPELAPMLDALKGGPGEHRGTYIRKTPGIALGWKGRPGFAPTGFPLWNQQQNIFLLFSGEHFATEAAGEASKVVDYSPPAIAARLMSLYESHGSKFLEKLNGTFSGVILDLRQQEAILFNDRFGLGRLYYRQTAEAFYFASEAKSLLAVLPDSRQIDQRGLAEFYSVGCVLQNRSLFKGISLIPGGAKWTFRGQGKIDKQQYFDRTDWEQAEPLSEESYNEQLQGVFSRIAPAYTRGDERTALSLTGGLDSRMLIAWANAAPNELPCYTFNGPYRDCADVRIARQLARVCHQPHSTIPIEKDFFADFSALAEDTVYATDGTMDISGSIELYVNRLAREIAPVRLTGNYGSEILRANVAFRPGKLDTTLYTPEFVQLLEQAAETYRSEAVGNQLSFIAFKQVPWHHYSRRAVEQVYLKPRSPFLDNELVALAYRVPRDLTTSTRPLLRLIAAGNPNLAAVATDRAHQKHLIPAFGTISRAWQNFTAKAEYAYDYGMPQRLVKIDQALSGLHLEKLFLGRHKFYHFRIWYRNQLSGYLKEKCSESSNSLGHYRDGASAKKILQEHLSGRSNRTSELHKAVTLQLIGKLFVST